MSLEYDFFGDGVERCVGELGVGSRFKLLELMSAAYLQRNGWENGGWVCDVRVESWSVQASVVRGDVCIRCTRKRLDEIGLLYGERITDFIIGSKKMTDGSVEATYYRSGDAFPWDMDEMTEILVDQIINSL